MPWWSLLLLSITTAANAQWQHPPEPEHFPRYPHRHTLDLEFDWSRASAEWPQDYRLLLTVQALDVLTTHYAIQHYDCVQERNPLLSEKPDLEDLILLKTLVMIPLVLSKPTKRQLEPVELVTGYVVVNNLDVIDRARPRC